MKRSADSQLTRENLEDEVGTPSDGPREFQRATEKELAKRVIKPLPNRRGGSGSPAPQSGPKPSLPASTSGTTSSATSSGTSTGSTLAPTSQPFLSTGPFAFKQPATESTRGSSSTAPFKGFGSGTSTTAPAGSGTGGFSFKLPTTKPKESAPSTSEPAANGTNASPPSFGGLPPFNPTAASPLSSAPTSNSADNPADGAGRPSSAESTSKATFSFRQIPPSSSTSTSSLPFSFPRSTTTTKPSAAMSSSSNSKLSATQSSETPAPQNMTATAKAMSSIFSSMTSESPPRPPVPGFKAANGGPAISPEKSVSSAINKSKSGSFSFGGGIPKKPAPAPSSGDKEMKEKVDKGKGKATTSTGTFGLGRGFSPTSPVEDIPEEDEEQAQDGDTLIGGLDAGDFDPALNDEGTPMRKPHYHPDHQEAYEDDQELKYWIHLRGLNTSFLREIISMQGEDPFIDLSGVFRSYKEFRREIVGEMVDWLRANGKGDGTESAGEEESDSEDEEMYYEEAKVVEADGDLMDESDEPNDPTSIAERQFRAHQERERLQPIDRDKTPPAGPQPPRAPVGGLYIFGNKPLSSFAGAATTGGGFVPTGSAAVYESPSPETYTFERPGLRRPKTPVASTPPTGFTPIPTTNDSMQGVKSTSPKPSSPSKSGFAPSSFTPSGSGSAPTSATPFVAKPPSDPSTSAAPTASGSGFTPSTTTPFAFKPSSNPPAAAPAPVSGFGFTPSSTTGFSFGAQPSKPPSPTIPKTPEAPLKSPTTTTGAKSSTFPGFGPITGGPSGSPFGTKRAAAGVGTAAPSSASSAFGGSAGGSSLGSVGKFGGFGSTSSVSGGVTSAGGIAPSGAALGATTLGSATTQQQSAFKSAGDPAKPPLPFGNKPSSVWPASTPEASKPGGLFGTPPSASGSGSIFGLAPPTGPSPFGSGGAIFGAKPATGGTAPSVFGSGSVFGKTGSSSAFGSGGATSFAPTGSSGDPSKRSDEPSSKASDGKDELEEEDENTTPKAKPVSLPSDHAPPAPSRTGIANPWATASSTSTSSLAPTVGGPFKFGMGSKPAVTEPESPAGSPTSKSTGFSFADPPAAFKLPPAGSFSFADPPKSTAGSTGAATFTNPFASPPKTGTLPGFGSISGGFGSSTFGSGSGSGSAPPLFGGQTTPGGTFSFGAPSTLAKGPFLSSTAGRASQPDRAPPFGGGAGAASGPATSDSGAGGSSAGAGSSQDSDIAPEGGTGLALGEDKFDQPGPGEEMEESLFTVRGKVMKFSDSVWVDMGIGHIRLYKHKETGAKRVFARNSKSGRILLNFAPFTKMEPKIDEHKSNFMRMTAMDDGKLVKILVKLKEESEASQLVNVLQKEVETLS